MLGLKSKFLANALFKNLFKIDSTEIIKGLQ